MKLHTVTLTAAAFALSLSVAGTNPAQARPVGPKPGHGRLMERLEDRPTTRVVEMMTERLELTREQQEKIGGVLDAAKAELKQHGKEARSILSTTHEQILEVLTPEQRGKAGKMKEALFAGVGGFAKSHAPHLREGLQRAGDEIRIRAALSTLELDDEQRGKLMELQAQIEAKREKIISEVRPQFDALREEANSRIREVLTPDQQAELEQKLDRMPKGPGRDQRAGSRHARRAEAGHPGPDHQTRGERSPRAESAAP